MHIYFFYFISFDSCVDGGCVGGWVRVKLDPKSKNISRILHLETVSASMRSTLFL